MKEEKRENGIKKLIDFINEMEVERFGEQREKIGYDTGLDSCHLISKKDGFIKWLIDNDKIDYEEYSEEWRDSNINNNADFFILTKSFDIYDSLIMILSIQDNPIEYLCSILKE